MVFGLEEDFVAFPNPELAEPDGLLAVGGELNLEWLLTAYFYGIFPWYSIDGEPYWYSLDPRMVLMLEDFRYSKSLQRVVRSGKFQVKVDTNFLEVMKRCASADREDQDGTWITDDFIQGYVQLHEEGFAHSFETYLDGELVGGLYGVSIGDVFSGESMFHAVTDASKVAFVALVEWCRRHGFRYIDAQQPTNHLASLGAKPISRKAFLELQSSLQINQTIRGQWYVNTVMLLIGGNQGDRVQLMMQANAMIQKRIGNIAKVSSIYETAPWGFEAEQDFLNMALVVDTNLSVDQVLAEALAIEAELGRIRVGEGYHSRPMDIDLIFYNNDIIDTPHLQIPHPRMHLRRFVLQPLAEIVPQYCHPVLNKTMQELLDDCPDACEVKAFM